MDHLKRSLCTLLLVCTLSVSAAAGIIHGGGDKTTPPPPPPSDTTTQSVEGEPTVDTSGGEEPDLVELIVEAGSTLLSITFSLV